MFFVNTILNYLFVKKVFFLLCETYRSVYETVQMNVGICDSKLLIISFNLEMLAHRFYPVAIFCYRLLVIHCSCHETVKMDIGIQINWREQNTVNIQHTFNDYFWIKCTD